MVLNIQRKKICEVIFKKWLHEVILNINLISAILRFYEDFYISYQIKFEFNA